MSFAVSNESVREVIKVLQALDRASHDDDAPCVDPATAKREGRIAVDYQPSSGEGPQDWTPKTLYDEWDNTTHGGYGPTYCELVGALMFLYSAFRQNLGGYVQRITFEFPEQAPRS